MQRYATSVRNTHYTFADLREVMAKASPLRSGDCLAGLAAANEAERVAARTVLANVPLTRFLEEPLIPYESDEVTRLILDEHDANAFKAVRDLTVGGFREWLLAYETTTEALSGLAPGLTPEMAAAVSKVCRNQDLVLIAGKCRVLTRFRDTLGLGGRLSVRIQPNHPTDDLKGIAASTVDGLLYGCGDAVIGVNPATDNVANTCTLLKMLRDLIEEYGIPTQACVLAHVTTSLRAIEAGAPLDLMFQSIAGTEAANRSFGIDLKLLAEAHAAARGLHPDDEIRTQYGASAHATTPPSEVAQRNPDTQARTGRPPDVMYFETGQGSALSANAHHGIDQQTCEARAYAVARKFKPLLVNTVVGFIGPEYLYDGKQIIRAGLEDHFCGKLLGVPMGVDVCYTNHAEADQDDLDVLLTLLGAAGVNFIMGVPGADDIMLNYQSTSYHDSHYLRQLLGLRPAPEFEAWLEGMGVMDGRQGRLLSVQPRHPLLEARGSE